VRAVEQSGGRPGVQAVRGESLWSRATVVPVRQPGERGQGARRREQQSPRDGRKRQERRCDVRPGTRGREGSVAGEEHQRLVRRNAARARSRGGRGPQGVRQVEEAALSAAEEIGALAHRRGRRAAHSRTGHLGKDGFVFRFDAPRHRRGAELALHAAMSRLAAGAGPDRIVEERGDRRRERSRIALGHELPGHTVLDDFREAAGAAGDHRRRASIPSSTDKPSPSRPSDGAARSANAGRSARAS
jgi:hypothetical protein